ncbi:MAG: hypothetical protein HOQ29_00345 [Acidobacteria bacterium]|nr:hypothetical protein [Acidobacteriota bacterium]
MAHVRFTTPIALTCFALAFVFGLTVSHPSAVLRADSQDVVRLVDGTAVNLATPSFLQVGKRYAFTWPGGGPPQTYAVKTIRPDGWILVEVADETTRPDLYIPGEFPVRWLHVGLAVSVQEMRPLP